MIADIFTKALIFKGFGHFCHLLAPFSIKACMTLCCTLTDRPMRTAGSSWEAMSRRTVRRLRCSMQATSVAVSKGSRAGLFGIGVLMQDHL